MQLLDWITLALVCLAGAVSPGPSLAVIIRSTMNGGLGRGLVTSWAHAAGVGLYALLSAVGLALLITQSPVAFRALTYAGAAFLLYLSLSAWRASRRRAGDASRSLTEGASLGAGPLHGLLLALLNPKIAIWFLALFGQFVRADATLAERLAMALVAFSIDGLWYSVVVYCVSRGPVLRWLRRNERHVQRVFAVLLLIVALRVALS
ncbi:MAG: LysE family translocator [Myxococcales bacterium]|nr:LysE family translocator [Myxococcales bacterium]